MVCRLKPRPFQRNNPMKAFDSQKNISNASDRRLKMVGGLLAGFVLLLSPAALFAQSVCLPSPRLMTTMPMGGKRGTVVTVKITGQHLDEVSALTFSRPEITAKPLLDTTGTPVPSQFVVSIDSDCPIGVHEARVTTRLGISTSRAFNVGDLIELEQQASNRTLQTAMKVSVDSICNSLMTKQAVDYYSFEATKGQRIIVDCAAQGIDSKLKPVVIIADASGADLMVERRGGLLDFSVPDSGEYVVKVHDLTFNGGQEYFYRLAIRKFSAGDRIARMPSTSTVNSFSWPPAGLDDRLNRPEVEPNNSTSNAQRVELPCDISGSFYPAADMDLFEFEAKKGDVWWVEVASERLGLPTDPSIVVQSVDEQGNREDVAEFSDIASPVKVSSNGYSYDGPPYNAGSSDIIGKLEIKRDGIHQLKISDLFGGTRNEPQNVYRLLIRKPQPDFALVAWSLHMNLRNGDRNALSKPIALRAGGTIPIEVVAIRRDGFNGPIDLKMTNLPPGVTAAGVRIPAGQSRGIMLVSAHHKAPSGLSSAVFSGVAELNGVQATRTCHWASMKWPVANAWSEIPSPRLIADVPVSVSNSEFAPLTIRPNEEKTWETNVNEKLIIPLVHTRRTEFSGATVSLKTFGVGFDRHPAFDASLNAETSQVVLDLAKLKIKPGSYTVAFYGSAVAKYRDNLAGLKMKESRLHLAEENANRLQEDLTVATANAQSGTVVEKNKSELRVKTLTVELNQLKKQIGILKKEVNLATKRSTAKDIVDIIVSNPIRILVNPVGKTATTISKKAKAQ